MNRAVIVLGLVYLIVGRVFALPATHVRGWRLAAWVVCGIAYSAHIGYEHFNLRRAPRMIAWHAALGVAIGALGLAVAGMIHSLWVGSAIGPSWLLALVVWPAITAIPAFLVAIAAALVLARLTPRAAGRSLVAAGIVLLMGQAVPAQDTPTLREIDRIRLAEAFKIGEALGDQVWKDWDKAPFAVLLVTPDHEFLIRHPKPSPDFLAVGHDPLLKSDIYVRKRTQPPHLLATFPAVSGSMVATIVIGQAENTDKKTSSPWVITVLHEHFHQLQNSQPSYYADVDALQLSGGDQSGMWMLNYRFPYEKDEVKRQFEKMSRRLAQLLEIDDKSVLEIKLPEYLAERKKLETMLDPDDYKYFSFQVWQEGIARYTEYRIAALAAEHYKPSKEFRALNDFKRFSDVAEDIRTGIQIGLSTLELDKYERVAFYPLGAGEALLLDRIQPRWKRRYFSEKFYVDRYF